MFDLRRRVLNRIRRMVRKTDHRAPVISFNGEMTIDEAWTAHPRAPEVFARYNLPTCDGCSVRFEETLAEASEAYGINLDRFLSDLNALGI